MARKDFEDKDMDLGEASGTSGVNVRESAIYEYEEVELQGSCAMEMIYRRLTHPYEMKWERYDDEEIFEQPRASDQMESMDDEFRDKRPLKWATVDYLETLKLFNNDTIEYLRGLSEFAYNHQEVGYHIRNFIEEEVQNDPEGFDTFDKVQLKNDLSYLAFTDEISEKAVEKIDGSILCSQNASYWATSILENWVMCDQGGSYKYCTTCQDVWIENSFPCAVNGQNRDKRLQIFNENENVVSSVDFWDERFQYFYHGTDWDSVDSIVRNGIFLTGGCFGQDFSFRHCPGFYVYRSIESGRVWARSKAACPAVIIFKVPVDLFRDSERHLDLRRREDEFQHRVYRYHRSGGDRDCEIQAETVVCQSITGPMLLNSGSFIHNEEPPILSDDTQTCILDKAIASQFNSFISGIVYCKKKELREKTLTI